MLNVWVYVKLSLSRENAKGHTSNCTKQPVELGNKTSLLDSK